MTDPDPDPDSDETLVLPEHAVDDALDTVRAGADEMEDVPTPYTTGLVDGAEQMHRFLTSLGYSGEDAPEREGIGMEDA